MNGTDHAFSHWKCEVLLDTLCLVLNCDASSNQFRASKPIRVPIVGHLIRSSREEGAVNANNYCLPSSGYALLVLDGVITCELEALRLMAGSYSVSFWLCRDPQEQRHVDVLHFHVEDKDIWGAGRHPTPSLSCLR